MSISFLSLWSATAIYALQPLFVIQNAAMNSHQEKKNEKTQKTTAEDDEKKSLLFKRLASHSVQQFRDINIDNFDLNTAQFIPETEEIDTAVTPLIYAAFFGLKDIIKILLKNRFVDVDLQTQHNKQTPLTTACTCGNYEIVRLLLLSKAEVNKPNLMNQTPLTVTLFRLAEQPASFQNKKICFLIAQLLIKQGADVDWIIDKKNGYALLHYFCNSKMKMNKAQRDLNCQIIKFLLQKGANQKQLTLGNKSCEELLKQHCNREEIVNLMKEYESRVVSKVELKPIKKIDANFFKIDPQL